MIEAGALCQYELQRSGARTCAVWASGKAAYSVRRPAATQHGGRHAPKDGEARCDIFLHDHRIALFDVLRDVSSENVDTVPQATCPVSLHLCLRRAMSQTDFGIHDLQDHCAIPECVVHLHPHAGAGRWRTATVQTHCGMPSDARSVAGSGALAVSSGAAAGSPAAVSRPDSLQSRRGGGRRLCKLSVASNWSAADTLPTDSHYVIALVYR